MASLIAQAPVSLDRAFDVADGFAITLILMLFLVLGGVALVARGFRRRERHPQQEVWQEMESGESDRESRRDKSVFPLNGSPGGAEDAPWERDGDWWKQSPEGED